MAVVGSSSLARFGLSIPFLAPAPPSPERCVLEDLNKDMFLEVQNETCS